MFFPARLVSQMPTASRNLAADSLFTKGVAVVAIAADVRCCGLRAPMKRSTASTELWRPPGSRMLSRRTSVPSGARTPRVIHRQTVALWVGRPLRPLRNAGSFATSARRRSWSRLGSIIALCRVELRRSAYRCKSSALLSNAERFLRSPSVFKRADAIELKFDKSTSPAR